MVSTALYAELQARGGGLPQPGRIPGRRAAPVRGHLRRPRGLARFPQARARRRETAGQPHCAPQAGGTKGKSAVCILRPGRRLRRPRRKPPTSSTSARGTPTQTVTRPSFSSSGSRKSVNFKCATSSSGTTRKKPSAISK